MSNPAVTGGLSNMSMWVTFEDDYGRTRIFRRENCSRHPIHPDAIVVERSEHGTPLAYVHTKLTYDEIFGVK